MSKFVSVLLVSALVLVGCQGSKGDLGATGASGVAGATGPAGAQGAVGPAGADGTVITAVQFCPDAVATYPSVFPEVGLLINGVVYGVYSLASGSFLSPLPAGLYASSAVGSACTFTINADGSISN